MLMRMGELLTFASGRPAEQISAGWQALIGRSAEPAGLMRPELLQPLLAADPGVALATVTAGPDLLVALPVTSKRFPTLAASWVSPLTPGGAPHLDRDQGPAALATLLKGIGWPLLLHGIPADGPFHAALMQAAGRHAVVDRWQRAALRVEGTYAAWADAALGAKRRKEFRRLKNRLAEQGVLTVSSLAPGDDVGPFAEALLQVEGSGWKGQRGTAIATQPDLAPAFHSVCANLHAAGALRFWQIGLDGRAIASLYAIVEGDRAWLGKIGYDEAYAKYSPGVLLILEATERLFAEPGLKLVDSCAIPDHPMIDHLWRDRIAIADVLAAGAGVSAARFAASLAAEKLRRRARGVARDAYYRLRGLRRS